STIEPVGWRRRCSSTPSTTWSWYRSRPTSSPNSCGREHRLYQLRALPLVTAPPRVRLVLWAAGSVLAAITLYRSALEQIAQVLTNPTRVVDDRLVHLWGVLLLCGLGLFLKRARIARDLPRGTSLLYVATGIVLVGTSLFLFPPANLLMG